MPDTLTINGVTTTILADGGVREAQPREGPEAHVTFQCAWDKRYDLLRGLLPQATWTGSVFMRTPSYAYPPSPNLYALWCTGITGVKPKRDATGWLVYEKAHVGVQFKIPTFAIGGGNVDPSFGGDPSGQPWTTTTVETSGEVIKVPGNTYVLENGEPLEESATGLIEPQYTIRVRRHWSPIVPLSLVDALMGGVNSDPIWFADKTFPKGTLMFAGMDTDQAVDTAGTIITELVYTLLGRGRDRQWNEFYNSKGNLQLANTESDLSGSYPFPYVALHYGSTQWLGLP